MANGYVRYGNSIHLDGFQILDFCIENAISLESLRDLNLGRKVFLTGNDTNAGYLRENVWDGTRWRAAAYLDDIDKINEKLDLIFGDELDTDTIIDSWKEVQDFLSGIEDTKNLMTMLDEKLDKKGGTMTGGLTVPHLDVASASGNAWIRFKSGGEEWGYIGFAAKGRPKLHDGEGWYDLLYTGNYESLIGDTYLKTDGSNRMAKGAYIDWSGSNADGEDYDSFGYGIRVLSYNTTTRNYRGGIHVGTRYGFQLTREANNDKNYLTVRFNIPSNNNVWSDWKTIAFTDSTVAAAYKLKNPSTNADVVTITDEGNVLVGNTFEGFKFSVYGGMTFLHGVESSALVLGQMPTNGLLVGNINYGIGQWFQGGQGHIQASSFGNTTATAYALNLNPLGGAVNVGGNLAPNANNSLSLGTSSYRWSDVYSVKGDFSDYINLSGDIGSILYKGGSFIRFEANDVCIGTSAYAPSLTLGSKSIISFRTGNDLTTVASITKEKSTFSNRVLIGGAADDENYALITKGNWKISQKNNADYFAISLRDVNVDYEGYDSVDGWCNHNFISNGTTRFFVAGRDAKWSYIQGKFRAYGEFRAEELATFAAGALIPTGQKLTIGSVTFEEDADGRVKVDGDMYTTGTLASGGKAKEGTGTGSGSANVRDFELPADGKTTYDCDHLLKSKNVIVQVFEKAIQNNIEVWEMILTDVTIVTEDRVTVTFGRPTNKVHKVHIIGGNVS